MLKLVSLVLISRNKKLRLAEKKKRVKKKKKKSIVDRLNSRGDWMRHMKSELLNQRIDADFCPKKLKCNMVSRLFDTNAPHDIYYN